MPEGLIVFDARKTSVRIMLLGLVAAVVALAFFAVRWELGDMLGELTPPTDPNISDIANAAQELAPSDPRTSWLAATAEISVFTPEAIEASVGMLEETVRRSPFDFRWWIEYGRALEQADRPVDTEQALRRAISLSPNYAYPHWQLGNFYLRQGRGDEAIAELRLTTTNNRTYRNQVFALAWDYFGHQTAMVERLAADAPEVRSDLASFYAMRNQPSDALRVWNALSDTEKTHYPQTASSIAEALFELRAYRESLEFSRQAGIDPDAAAETITNGGFESPLKSADDTLFGWRIGRSDGRLDIVADPSVRHTGSRSLRVTFRSYNKQELYNLWQNVALSASSHYKLSFWLRTENLRSGGPPLVEVVDAADSKILGASQTFPVGTNDWQQITVNFYTPENSNGVSVRTSREACADTCPIVGIVWLDDFELANN